MDLAVALERHVENLVLVGQRGRQPDLVERRDLLAVDGEDAIARLQASGCVVVGPACRGCCRARGGLIEAGHDRRRRVPRGRTPDDGRHEVNARHADDDEEDRGEYHVHHDAGRDDKQPRTDRLVHEVPRILDRLAAFLHGVEVLLSEHLDVSAEREELYAVVRLALLDAEQPRAEPQREPVHTHVDALGGQEMAQLVHEYDQPEPEYQQERRPNVITPQCRNIRKNHY